MRTRSISRLLEEIKEKCEFQRNEQNAFEYEVNIDFDEASAAWKANKKSTGGGCYKYICEHRNKNNKKCRRNPIPGCEFCSKHNI
ncbi:MAG: hypothetical protein EBY20_04325 [Alphaproteobacteria bacterium]|uniref:Uncharacterized protein n=1 Tax=viral metagenome TaxID=1070528 RepID=A0A6C0HQU3_9ZZZZ|nr:hypothetical protein [Alphaproteobacteria bacterium]